MTGLKKYASLLNMPCACLKPDPKYPTNLEWGPAFWGILHTLAHYAGSLAHAPLLQTDERKHWADIFRELSDTLPCEECREHYKSMLLTSDTASLKTISYNEFGAFIKTTWWDFHNRVNVRLEKPVFIYENLGPTYGNGVPIKAIIKGVTPTMERAIKLSGVKIMAWKNFLKSVSYLIGAYGIGGMK